MHDDLLQVGQINITKLSMHKGTLVDILFETPQNTCKTAKFSRIQRDQHSNSQCHPECAFKKRQSLNKASNMIKITQFNSSLVIGEEKVHQKAAPLSSSCSPQKNFTIKKVAELKSKVAVTAQKIIEMELKKKEKAPHFQLNGNFNQNGIKMPIEKILVTTRCTFRNQAPTIQHLTSGISIDGDYQLMSERNFDESLSQFLSNQRKELKHSNDILGIANKTFKSNSFQDGTSMKKIEFLDFPDKNALQPTLSRKNTCSPRKHYSRHIQEQKKYQQIIQRQKRQMLQLKKELNKNYAKPFNPPQNISASAFIVYEADGKKSKLYRKLSNLKRQETPQGSQPRKTLLNSHKVIVSSNSRCAVQIASLTKIMTCILTLDLAKKYGVNLRQEWVTIGIFEQNIGGTSANIRKGEIYSIQELLYGLMLPSGNDASLALAVWGGKLLIQKQAAFPKKDMLASTATSDAASNSFKKKDCYERFIMEMNRKAVQLNMEKTHYANSHGLSNCENKSCVFDLALLCEYAMNNKQFRDIVSCKVYEANIKMENEDENGVAQPSSSNIFQKFSQENEQSMQNSLPAGQQEKMECEQLKDMENMEDLPQSYNDYEVAEDKSTVTNLTKAIRWENTHYLLQSKPNLYVGIKTGITNTAGPCLASCIHIAGKNYIIIVLNCKSMKFRFKDTENLRKWLFDKEDIKYKEDKRQKIELISNNNIGADEDSTQI